MFRASPFAPSELQREILNRFRGRLLADIERRIEEGRREFEEALRKRQLEETQRKQTTTRYPPSRFGYALPPPPRFGYDLPPPTEYKVPGFLHDLRDLLQNPNPSLKKISKIWQVLFNDETQYEQF